MDNSSKKVGIYGRVSTKKNQDINTQLILIREYLQRNNFNIIEEYVDIGESGNKEKRPAFNELIDDMRKGKINTIVVYKLDRIGRSLQHLLKLFEEFDKRGIDFISITQNIDTTTPEGRMFLKLLMVIAEYERELIIDRVNAGISRARKQNKKLGRPKTKINLYEVIRRRNQGESLRTISKHMEIPIAKLSREIKVFQNGSL
ncbi:MAG: recombinase family protein [Nanoarchaeota archaeon]|nr:recombinase family protein [Nanoarchaeota archaeon]